jgi:hypothetical protein
MTIREYLMKAVEDDARRAGERDRMLLEARRARIAGRQHAGPATPASRLARILFRRATALPSVTFHSTNEITGPGGQASLIAPRANGPVSAAYRQSWANNPGIEAATPEVPGVRVARPRGRVTG